MRCLTEVDDSPPDELIADASHVPRAKTRNFACTIAENSPPGGASNGRERVSTACFGPQASRGSCMLGGRKKETANQFFDVLAGPARWGHGGTILLVCLLVAETAMAEPPATIPLELTGQHQIDHATHHVQGVAVSAESYWISSVDRPARQGFVFRVDRATGKVAAQAQADMQRAVSSRRHRPGRRRVVGARGRISTALDEHDRTARSGDARHASVLHDRSTISAAWP